MSYALLLALLVIASIVVVRTLSQTVTVSLAETVLEFQASSVYCVQQGQPPCAYGNWYAAPQNF